jgi:N-methylhydantoinase B
VLQVRADRHTFRPYGLYGGGPGKPSRNRLISGGQERELTAKVTMTPMRRGDVFIHDQPGPGGWGDPLEREPARVLRDVLNELVGPESARNDYGVVIDTATLAVDVDATAGRRAELRAARGWTTPPAVSR